jgi:anti-sigma regulatory factor (Ser/Thr protein kinase)
MSDPQPLTYATLDDLAFAAQRGRLDTTKLDIIAQGIGPAFELRLLADSGLLPQPERAPWLTLNGIEPLLAAVTSRRRRQWVCPKTRRLGVYRTSTRPSDDSTAWVEFCVAAEHAAVQEGFPKSVSAQLIGAIGEMQDNIYEHSRAADTGIVVFRAQPGSFEFLLADRGVGVLQSLSTCPDYEHLTDHGEALRLALTDGISRYGAGSGRGRGFRPLFIGLANLNAALRFRSGDHALTIDGQNPKSTPAKLAQKPKIDGFFASANCLLHNGISE